MMSPGLQTSNIDSTYLSCTSETWRMPVKMPESGLFPILKIRTLAFSFWTFETCPTAMLPTFGTLAPWTSG